MTGSDHRAIPNQGAAGERAELYRLPGIIDAPDHDHPDVGIPVLEINGDLGWSRH